MREFIERNSRDTIWNAIFGVSLVVWTIVFSFGAVVTHVA